MLQHLGEKEKQQVSSLFRHPHTNTVHIPNSTTVNIPNASFINLLWAIKQLSMCGFATTQKHTQKQKMYAYRR